MNNIFNLLNNDLMDKIFDEVDEYDKQQYEIKMNTIQYNRVIRELKFDFNYLLDNFKNINPLPYLLFSIIKINNEYDEDMNDFLDNYNNVIYDMLHTVDKVY
jgi:hypothetical protein